MTQGDNPNRQISDDGRWEWDGSQWLPRSQQGQTPPPPPSRGYQGSSYAPQPQPTKSHTLRNVLLIVVLLLVLFVGGCIALIGGAVNEVDKAIDEAEKSETKNDNAEDGSSFKNGVLTTPDMKVVITRHEVIPVGEKGNEYGSKPIIAFWYDMTNRTAKALSPTDIVMVMTAYQDNNPNAENELEVGMHPDDSLLDAQMENIKKGGTVEGAVAYELDDLKTPVELVASDDFGMNEIGTVTYNLK